MALPLFSHLLIMVLCSAIMLVTGLFLIANYNRLLRRRIENEWVRKNLVVWMAAMCLILALIPLNPEFARAFTESKWRRIFLIQIVAVTAMTFVVFNITWLVMNFVKHMEFRYRMIVVLLTIIIATMLMAIPVNYFGNNGKFQNVNIAVLYNFYMGCITGLIYITMSYIDLDRQRKLSEKELELLRLRELKTKAELEVLHAKINPHFLYNALNSIADLSITDGKKARKMTVALADLFRFSINYSNHNYSSVKEEVEMAEVYLQIEKIRFEDKLTYTIDVDPEVNHFLVPRFVLQPLVENAVKHGLKITGDMTQILLEVKRDNDGLVMNVIDNGPPFPEELKPGYGVKSVYDKMDLLFGGKYQIHFRNAPRKEVSIHINKLIKNESGF